MLALYNTFTFPPPSPQITLISLSKNRLISKSLGIHTQRLDREDEFVVGVRNHAITQISLAFIT